MYIKIKFKHLLLLSVIVLGIAFSGIFLRGPAVYMMGLVNEAAGVKDKAGVYYDRASEIAMGSTSSIQAAKRKIEMFYDKTNVSFVMEIDMYGGSTGLNGAVVDYGSIEEINRRYAQISANAAKSNLLAEYSMEVAFMNYFSANAGKAVEILDSLDYITDSRLKAVRSMYSCIINMRLGNLEKGFNEIKGDLDKKDRFSVIRQELVKYYLFYTGDYEGFGKIKYDTPNWYNSTKNMKDVLVKPLLSIQNDMSGYENIVKKQKTGAKTGNSLTGRVTDGARPMQYVLVYLKSSAYMFTHMSNTGSSPGLVKAVLTDGDGYFHIDNVPNGTYAVGFCTDWSRVSGKTVLMNRSFNLKFSGSTRLAENIRFIDTTGMVKAQNIGDGKIKFDINMPVGAAYYTISMGEARKDKANFIIYNYTYPSSRITETSYVLDTAKELHNGMQTGISYCSDGVDPYQWMEIFYHTGEYVYCVDAYDSKGGLIADSRGIFPVRKIETVHIEGREWSGADRLLLDKKYDEAIKNYEKLTESENDETLHAIKTLAKLYLNGWVYNPKTYQLEGRDDAKAKKYLEMLDARIESDYVKSSLADIYVKERQFEKALDIFNKIAAVSSYEYQRIGRIYGYMGDYAKAEEAYKTLYEKNSTGADYLMMLYTLEGRDDILIEWAPRHDVNSYSAEYEKAASDFIRLDRSKYKEFFKLVKSGKPAEAEQLLKNDESELGNFYKGLLALQQFYGDYSEREKAYTSYYEKVNSPRIKEIMKYFGRAGLNTGFGENY